MFNSRGGLPSLVLAVAVAGSVAVATPSAAHHSFALFDSGKTVTLEGTVGKFEWTNPHSWIYLEVAASGRTTEEWEIELPSAGVLAREGWNKNFVKIGDRISVYVHPLKSGAKAGSLESFTPQANAKN